MTELTEKQILDVTAEATLEGIAMKSITQGREACPACGHERRIRGCYRGQCYAPNSALHSITGQSHD